MDYNFFVNKLGEKFDIVNGDLVSSDTGRFMVSDIFQDNVIYLNPLTQQCFIVSDKESYVGHEYELGKNDCISLVSRWLDDHHGSNYAKYYRELPRRQLIDYMAKGMPKWFQDAGFDLIELEQLEYGDCLVYANVEGLVIHIGIYLGGHKILHQLPDKLSSIDDLDRTKIVAIYRYNGRVKPWI